MICFSMNDNWLERNKIRSIIAKLNSTRVVGRMYTIKVDSFSVYESESFAS